MRKLTIDPNYLMENNLNYLSKLFKEDYLSKPTIMKKGIVDMLNTAIILMIDKDYTVTNIAATDNGIVLIYITDEHKFTHRIYNGVIDGAIIKPISDTLNTDKIHNNKELEFTIDTIVNLFYFLFKMSYIKNSPYIHGLDTLEELEEVDEVIELEEEELSEEDKKIIKDMEV